MSIDLNIENYELDEIINLFNIPYLFSEVHLKQAKRQVLLTHPDKSKLDKKYFLFYLAAYRILYDIHTFRTNQEAKEKTTTYNKTDYEGNENPILIDKIKNSSNFNHIFNKVFEELNGDSYKKNGYDEWYRNECEADIECMNCKTPKDFQGIIEKKRLTMSSAITTATVHDTVNGNTNNSFLDDTETQENGYSSGLFGKLQYDDLKQAHQNTIIPVIEKQDLNNRTIQGIRAERNHTISPLDDRESSRILNINKENDKKVACQRAYKLYKQDEKAKKMSEVFLSKFKQLSI